MKGTLPACGFHYDVSFEEYTAWPALNWSTVKHMRGTASKCKYNLDNPQEATKAMKLGSALHVATLEPARFEGLFYIHPKTDRRTREGKEEYAKMVAEAGSRLMIAQGESEHDELNRLQGMAKSVRSSRAASKFLDSTGRNEVSILWKDEVLDVYCKARLDKWIENLAPVNRGVIVDLKSCQSATDYHFGKDVVNRGYHGQLASYKAGVKAITGKDQIFVFIAVESEPPFDSITYIPDDDAVHKGLACYRECLTKFVECQKSGNWPGYDDKVHTLSLPKWSE